VSRGAGAAPEAGTVLVVEDNPITRKMIGVVLRAEGYRVLEAPDGRTAIDLMTSGNPDVILQDLLLPDIDGFELVKRLRRLPGGEQVAIIAVSGLSSRLDQIRVAGPEFNDFVMKPIEPSRLVRVVRTFLPQQKVTPGSSGHHRRMVLNDDDPVQRKLAALHFTQLGFTVTAAADGAEGLEAIRRVAPDIVVSDVLMPRVDGFELCRTLRREPAFARLPIVLVSSAYIEDEDRRFARRAGANDLVLRTPDLKVVIDAVAAALRGELPSEAPQAEEVVAVERAERLVRQLERQADSNATLARRCAFQAAELAMLAGISQVLARIDRVEAMLNEILVRCLDAAGLSRGAILLRDEHGRLAVQAQVGYDPEEWSAIEPTFVASSVIEEAAVSDRTVAVPSDRVAEEEAHVLLRAAKATSGVLAPLSSGRESLGVLVLLAAGERDLTDDDWLPFAQAAAAQLGQAIGLSRAFAMVAASESRYRLLFEANPYPVLVFDPETLRFLAVNDAAIGHYGYSHDEFLAMTILDIRPPEDIPRALEALGETGLAHRGEWRHRKKDGTIIDVEITRQVVDFAGRSARMVLVRDITDLKRAAREKESLEEQLRQAQKMEAVGRLAGGVAHDFNNLLTVIAGRSHFLVSSLGPEDPGRRHVELIQKSAERAAKLTRQLLAFSRKQILELKLVDLGAVATGIESLLRRLIGEDVSLVVGGGEGLGRVKADPGQIEQVILNLAINARDAMPSGGPLTIETANVELDTVYAAHHAEVTPGPYVVLAVSDTGTGMDAATQARLFEPFFTTKEPGKGTGLGLATVYGIVKQSGGHIAVYSEPGRGSTFKVYLPRVEGSPDAVESVPAATPPSRGSETVLLVEDEAELRELAEEVLSSRGYTVLQAGSPAEALQLAERHDGPVHLLLTDVVMPGMSGRELADRLLGARPALKALFMSGYTDTAIVHHGVLDPGTPFLQKPFTPDALVRKVRDVLDQSRAR
jgi:two-component system cell cycle sensor histidine kinase/response regulator CckA